MNTEDLDLDLTLDPETIQAYAAASDRNLTAPSPEENPTFKGGKEPGLGTWTEIVRIRDTDITTTKKEPENKNKLNFVLTFSVEGPEANGFPTNAGRPHTEYLFIDKLEMLSTDTKTSGGYKRRISTLNSLLAAVGVDLGEGVPSYAQYLRGEKPLLGSVVQAVFRKYRNNKTNETAVQIDGFMPVGS